MVLVLTGVSMVNAAMNTQLVLDRFDVTGIVVSGVAGGVDPALQIGDVTVAAQWGQYLEAVFAREQDGTFKPPPWWPLPYGHFGMIFPSDTEVRSATGGTQKRFWFEADPGHALGSGQDRRPRAEAVASARRSACPASPGWSWAAKACRDRLSSTMLPSANTCFKTFQARVLDMESAAVATVAYANGVPFIAFRSLSDLAGGGPGTTNQILTFLELASGNSAAVVKQFLMLWTPQR